MNLWTELLEIRFDTLPSGSGSHHDVFQHFLVLKTLHLLRPKHQSKSLSQMSVFFCVASINDLVNWHHRSHSLSFTCLTFLLDVMPIDIVLSKKDLLFDLIRCFKKFIKEFVNFYIWWIMIIAEPVPQKFSLILGHNGSELQFFSQDLFLEILLAYII